MKFAEAHWLALVAAAAAALVAAGGTLYWWRRRPRDPEEIERRRRSHLNQVGRIVEGEVLEILDGPAPEPAVARKGIHRRRLAPSAPAGNGARKLVCYSYSISGVTYQAAQDVTGLEERSVLDRVATGQVTSVKYDPANPGNSILVAENWSGLR